MASVIKPGATGITVGVDGFTLSDLAYADDIALFQPDSESMQLLLDRLATEASRVGLGIKPAKTKSNGHSYRPP